MAAQPDEAGGGRGHACVGLQPAESGGVGATQRYAWLENLLPTWAVSEALTWSRGWEQTRGPARQSAVSETWAHLVHLQGRQRVINHGRERDSWTPGPRCSAAD